MNTLPLEGITSAVLQLFLAASALLIVFALFSRKKSGSCSSTGPFIMLGLLLIFALLAYSAGWF